MNIVKQLLTCALATVFSCMLFACSGSITQSDSTDAATTSQENEQASTSVQDDSNTSEFRNRDLGNGMQPTGSLELEYACALSVDYYDGGYALICCENGERFLTIPENMDVPAGLADDIALIQLPLQNVYLVSSGMACLVDALDVLDCIVLTNMQADDCSIAGFRAAIEAGDIVYGGKYNAPDYELIVESGCTLAIENTMISHVPDVKEKLTSLGTVVFTEQTSLEASALGRLEWVKLFGLLFGRESEAAELFEAQEREVASVVKQVEEERASDSLGNDTKTVAFFHINSDGAAVTRRPGDYISQMIELAGGSSALSSLEGQEGTSGVSVTVEMEAFYAECRDADIIVYNATIDDTVETISDLVEKNALLERFSAVQSGEVYIIEKDTYQQMTSTADIVRELHEMLTGTLESGASHIKKLS